MARFPTLNTNAIAQYPSGAGASYRTDVLTFVDGAEQRFRQWSGARRHWAIRLDLLDEAEIERLRRFFEGQSGRFGSFVFVDPWSGEEVNACAFDADAFVADFRSLNRAATTLRIAQVQP
jgi:uncharacterized protein (TIGR02217 family)